MNTHSEGLESVGKAEARKSEKRGRITEAAIAVFAERGFHAARVSDIARRAGVADGTIYLYFKNKEDLLLSIFEEQHFLVFQRHVSSLRHCAVVALFRLHSRKLSVHRSVHPVGVFADDVQESLVVVLLLRLVKMEKRLQKYNMARGKQGSLELDGGLSDVTTFNWEEGLTWEMGGGKTRHETDLSQWLGKRAGVGKRPPYGFPRDYKFS